MGKEKSNTRFGNIILSLFGIFKSFWNATIHIVWGIATMFLLVGLISYFKVDASSVLTLLNITKIIMERWDLFWWVFFIYECFMNLREVWKNDN